MLKLTSINVSDVFNVISSAVGKRGVPMLPIKTTKKDGNVNGVFVGLPIIKSLSDLKKHIFRYQYTKNGDVQYSAGYITDTADEYEIYIDGMQTPVNVIVKSQVFIKAETCDNILSVGESLLLEEERKKQEALKHEALKQKKSQVIADWSPRYEKLKTSGFSPSEIQDMLPQGLTIKDFEKA